MKLKTIFLLSIFAVSVAGFSEIIESPYTAMAAEVYANDSDTVISEEEETDPVKMRRYNISFCNIDDIEDFTYTGEPITPKPKVTIHDQTLLLGTDYMLTYSDNINVTDYYDNYQPSVTVTGIGLYHGSVTIPFNILPKDVSKCNYIISGTKSGFYTGKPVTYDITAFVDGRNFYEDNDFYCTYSNNVDVGIATVFLHFCDNYTGYISKTFYIVPNAPSQVTSSSTSNTSCTLTWSKVSNCSGYRIDKLNTSSKKYETVATVNGSGTCNYTLKELTKGTTVNVSITPYVSCSDGTTQYGSTKYYSFKAGKTVSSISATYIKNNSMTLAVNQKRTIVTNVLPSDAIEKNINWISSNASIAKVDSLGKVTGVAPGTATITGTAADGSGKKLSIKVTVKKRATSFSYSDSKLTIVNTGHQKYTYSEMVTDINQLKAAYSEFLSVNILGSSYDNRNIYEIILGNPTASKHILIVGSTHAREYMTTQLIMKQIELYCTYYYTGIYEGSYFSEIFDNTCVHFVPMLNPDGVTISQSGPNAIRNTTLRKNLNTMYSKYGSGVTSSEYFTRWKANARGVDLNRNYPVAAGNKFFGTGQPCSDGYYGPKAASEKETQYLIKLFNQISPNATISYHATGSILYWKYGQTGLHLKNTMILYNLVHGLTKYIPVTYVSKGTGFSDWVSSCMHTPAMTIEIGTSACPLKISEFSSIWSRNKYVPIAEAKSVYDNNI